MKINMDGLLNGENGQPIADYQESLVEDELAKLRARHEARRRFDAEESQPDDPTTTPVLADRLLTRSALENLPDPEPLIDDVLDRGTVALLYGKWGTGKSFIALDWAASVATGRAWQGRATEPHRVLYVAAEGAYGLKGRIRAWETGWKQTIHDGQLDTLPRPVNLTNASDINNLIALIDWNGYGFIILDTLARCMVGADENSAQHCGEVVDTLHRLREHTPGGRGVALGVHHTGKDGKTFRGSSVFEAGADTVYSVSRDGGPAIKLEREKRKDGPPVDVHRLAIDPVEGTGSAVLTVHRGSRTVTTAEQLLSIFTSTFGDIGAYTTQILEVSETGRTQTYHDLSYLRERET
jgi:predicted ATP-dependent serine protease